MWASQIFEMYLISRANSLPVPKACIVITKSYVYLYEVLAFGKLIEDPLAISQ